MSNSLVVATSNLKCLSTRILERVASVESRAVSTTSASRQFAALKPAYNIETQLGRALLNNIPPSSASFFNSFNSPSAADAASSSSAYNNNNNSSLSYTTTTTTTAASAAIHKQQERTLITQLLSHFKQTAEVRQYLKYYGRVDGDRFAVVKLSGDVLNSAAETARVAASLAFLHRIGLVPIVVHGAGLFTGRRTGEVSEAVASASESTASAQQVMQAAEAHMVKSNAKLVEALSREGVEALPFVDGVFGASADIEYEGSTLAGTVGRIRSVDVDAIASAVSSNRIPIVAAIGSSEDSQLFTFPTHDAAIALAKMIQPLKVIWLRPEGGLRTGDGEVVRSVDLARDAPHLIHRLQSPLEHVDNSADVLDGGSGASQHLELEAELAAKAEACVEELDLSQTDAESLVELASFHEVLHEPGATVSVTTPELLAEELFTHKGSGTLITRGERVFIHPTLESVDIPRLYSLIGAAFGMPLPDGYIEGLASAGKLKRIYITEGYRGAAVVLDTDGMGAGVSYLDKFAVDPSAQGDKLGEVLWRAMVQRERKLFWRSRSSNRVNPWYYEQSDGCLKAAGVAKDGSATGNWTVFWRNMSDDEAIKAVNMALAFPPTFPTSALGGGASGGASGKGRNVMLRNSLEAAGHMDGANSPPGIPTLK